MLHCEVTVICSIVTDTKPCRTTDIIILYLSVDYYDNYWYHI